MASIQLIEKNNGGTILNTYNVYCNALNISWTNSLDAKPYANSLSLGVSEVQKNGYENPLYNISGVTITGTAGTLTYNDLVRLSKLSTGSSDNYIVLNVDYGIGSNIPLIDSAEATGGIKVVIKNFNMKIGLDKEFSENRRVAFGTIVLQESS